VGSAAAATREERGEGSKRERLGRSCRFHVARPHWIVPLTVAMTLTVTVCDCPDAPLMVIVAVPAPFGVTVKVEGLLPELAGVTVATLALLLDAVKDPL
jgi:hypothetical protein